MHDKGKRGCTSDRDQDYADDGYIRQCKNHDHKYRKRLRTLQETLTETTGQMKNHTLK